MKKILAVLLMFVMITSFIGCTSNAPSTEDTSKVTETTKTEETSEAPSSKPLETVKIGVLFPMSGSSASSGDLSWMGTQMFRDYFNSIGGFKNWDAEIEFVLIDTETSPDVAAAGFERLVTEENVLGVIGNFNSATSATCVPLALKYGVPYMISSCVSDDLLAQENDYVFRAHVGNNDLLNTHVEFLKWLGEKMGEPLSTGAIIASADEFGVNTSKLYRNAFEGAGLDLVLDESVPVDTSDVSGVINKLKAIDPDIAVVILYTNEALLFQKGLREYKCDVPIMAAGAGYLEPTFIETVGKGTADYVFACSAWIPDSLNNSPEIAKQLVVDAKAKYGFDFAEAAMYSWTATGALIDAIDRAESLDRASIAKALKETDLGFDSTANMFANIAGIKYADFDGRFNQNEKATAFYTQIINGEWRVIYPDENIENNPMAWPIPSWDER